MQIQQRTEVFCTRNCQ